MIYFQTKIILFTSRNELLNFHHEINKKIPDIHRVSCKTFPQKENHTQDKLRQKEEIRQNIFSNGINIYTHPHFLPRGLHRVKKKKHV